MDNIFSGFKKFHAYKDEVAIYESESAELERLLQTTYFSAWKYETKKRRGMSIVLQTQKTEEEINAALLKIFGGNLLKNEGGGFGNKGKGRINPTNWEISCASKTQAKEVQQALKGEPITKRQWHIEVDGVKKHITCFSVKVPAFFIKISLNKEKINSLVAKQPSMVE